MRIRQFTEKDSAACCAVINAAIITLSGLNEAARAFILAKNDPGNLGRELAVLHTLVAVDGGVVVAVGALDGSEIKRLYVLPSHQNQGIGSAMLFALEEQARLVGLREVVVQSAPSSEKFYEARSYRRVRQEMTFRGEAEFTHVRMEKTLA